MECVFGDGDVWLVDVNGEERLVFSDLCGDADGSAECELHACLHAVCSCAGDHFVFSEDVVGVYSDFHMVVVAEVFGELSVDDCS